MKADQPLSTYSALFYPIAGGWILALDSGLTAWIAFLALVLLGAGTAGYHWRGDDPIEVAGVSINLHDLDQAGMNATYMAVATAAVGAPWWGVAGNSAAGVAAEYLGDYANHALMGGLVLLTVAAHGYSPMSLFGLGCMALGYVAWSFRTDLTHAIWHLFTAVGTCFLYLGG